MEHATAALAALEAVLLLMIEKKLLSTDEVTETLEDAAAALKESSSPLSATYVLQIEASLRSSAGKGNPAEPG